jgi:hypothetical protein
MSNCVRHYSITIHFTPAICEGWPSHRGSWARQTIYPNAIFQVTFLDSAAPFSVGAKEELHWVPIKNTCTDLATHLTPASCTYLELTFLQITILKTTDTQFQSEWTEEMRKILHLYIHQRHYATSPQHLYTRELLSFVKGIKVKTEKQKKKEQKTTNHAYINYFLLFHPFHCFTQERDFQLRWTVQNIWILQNVDTHMDTFFSVNSPWKMLIC